MSDAPLMVSVSGLRGLLGSSLTPDVASRFASAFGRSLQGHGGERARVVVGRDGRAGGECIHHAAIAALCAVGLDVTDVGVAATPTVGVAVDQAGAAGGMVVTASHNPQQWNGLKALVAGPAIREGVGAAAPDANAAAALIEAFTRGDSRWRTWDSAGTVTRDQGATEAHVDLVCDRLDRLSGQAGRGAGESGLHAEGLRVVVDSVEGAGAAGARDLLEALGCEEILHIGAAGTGIFPHPPEPLADNLRELRQAVVECEAHVGFAQDPDADRLALVDERGRYVGEEYTLALAAKAVLTAAGPGRVVCTNLSTSRMVDDVAASLGARVVRTPVGEANVVAAMRREPTVALGGEGNGGVIWPEVTLVRDSLSSMALVLWLMRRTGKALGQLVAEIPAYAIEKRKVEIASRDRASAVVAKVAAAWTGAPGAKVDTQDGVRLDFPQRRTWIHVRASNTEPILRLIAEAPTAAEAAEALDEAAKLVQGA